jgi:hypothetical protein
MARRRSRKITRRRRKQGLSLLNVAETVMLANATTQTLFNTNAYNFVAGGSGFGAGNEITLRELFNPNQVVAQRASSGNYLGGSGGGSTSQVASTFSLVQSNLSENWVMGASQMIIIPLTFKAIKAIGRPGISKINTMLRKVGIASTVKV